ncbi:MAG: hypothetical protein ABMA64_10375, partial [Myxococcota bacterium]
GEWAMAEGDARWWVVAAAGAGVVITAGLWVGLGSDMATSEAAARAAEAAGDPAADPKALFVDRKKAKHTVSGRTAEEVRSARRAVELGVRAPVREGEAPGVYAVDSDRVAAAIEAHRSDLDACWGAAAAHAPATPRQLVLELSLAPLEGQQRRSGITRVTTPVGSSFDDCATTVVADVVFATAEVMTLRYPMSFAPGGGG